MLQCLLNSLIMPLDLLLQLGATTATTVTYVVLLLQLSVTTAT